MIPFVFSSSQAYALEFGDLYMRVFKDEGQVLSLGVPYEIVTPYTEAALPELNYSQSADTMFLFQPTQPDGEAHALGSRRVEAADVSLLVEAHDELGIEAGHELTLSGHVGAGRVAQRRGGDLRSPPTWAPDHRGDGVAHDRRLHRHAARHGSTSRTRSPATALALGDWTLTESPKTGITPSAVGPESGGDQRSPRRRRLAERAVRPASAATCT
jgi:hypothetical protein